MNDVFRDELARLRGENERLQRELDRARVAARSWEKAATSVDGPEYDAITEAIGVCTTWAARARKAEEDRMTSQATVDRLTREREEAWVAARSWEWTARALRRERDEALGHAERLTRERDKARAEAEHRGYELGVEDSMAEILCHGERHEGLADAVGRALLPALDEAEAGAHAFLPDEAEANGE